MFKNPFSFEGRIRRTEYGISFIIYFIVSGIISIAIEAGGAATALGILYIPLVWFIWAQSAKRCHDRDNTGWFQLIPFYIFWMVFAAGDEEENRFGQDPKGPLAFETGAKGL